MLKKNGDMITSFLDVSSVYDNVRRDILIQNLVKDGCPIRLIRYVNHER